MSIVLQKLVWLLPDITSTETLLFIKLADYSSDDGKGIYPSLKTLSCTTKLGERCLRENLKSLVNKKYIKCTKSFTSKTPNHYEIDVEHLTKMAKSGEELRAALVKKEHIEGGITCRPGRNYVPPREELNAAKPLIEPLEEPLEKEILRISKKDELSPNQSSLENLSPEQKPMGVETDLLGSGKIILEETPTPKSEQSNEVEKVVGTSPNSPLKAEAVEAPKKSKTKGRVSKPKVQTTPMNPEMELTPELRKVTLDLRIEDKGLREGVIESEFGAFVDYYVAKGVSRPRWDLSWKNWCRNAITGDKYGRITMVNPPRTTVSDKPAEEVLPIDSAFKDFVAKHPDKDFYFRGAVFHEVRNDVLVIIQPNGEWRKDQLATVDELKSLFNVKHIRVYAKVSDISCFGKNKPEQIAINPGPSGKLDQALGNMAHGINRKEIKENAGISLVVNNPEKSTPVSSPLPKPSCNSLKPMQDSEIGEKRIKGGKS